MNFLLALIISLSIVHPIHLSKCEMEVNEKTNKMEITLHIYIDDLQEIIQKSGSPELFLATDHEHVKADSFIASYLQDHLTILNGAETMQLVWLGKEQSDDLLAFWCYLETKPVAEQEGLDITYSVLQDLYQDQQNILNVIKTDGEETYFLCRVGDNRAIIK